MTVSSADIAEVVSERSAVSAVPGVVHPGAPATGRTAAETAAVPDALPSERPAPASADVVVRSERTAERLRVHRERRMWALCGLALMSAALGATVVVVDVLR